MNRTEEVHTAFYAYQMIVIFKRSVWVKEDEPRMIRTRTKLTFKGGAYWKDGAKSNH